jgi:hypothetical protein
VIAMAYPQALELFESLQAGDRVEVIHDVKVGFRSWESTMVGTVVRKQRRRHSLHFNRNYDDKVFSDILVLRRDDGELTTITLDEFSQLRKLSGEDHGEREA